MATSNVYSVRRINTFVFFIGCISSSCCINAGLIADLNHLSPLVIKKYSQNPPLILNVMSGIQRSTGEIMHKLQAKPPSLNMKRAIRQSRSLWPMPKLPLAPYMLPVFPKPPLLSLFPNWFLRPFPIPTPIPTPIISKLSNGLASSKSNADIYKRLLDLKLKGTITSAEYFRLQKLLFSV